MAERGLVKGFVDELYVSTNAAERDLLFDRTVNASAGIVRINVR